MELNLVLLQEEWRVRKLRGYAAPNPPNPWMVWREVWATSAIAAWDMSARARELKNWRRMVTKLYAELSRNGVQNMDSTFKGLLLESLTRTYEDLDADRIRKIVNQLRDVKKLSNKNILLRVLLVPLFNAIALRQAIRLHDEFVRSRIYLADVLSRLEPSTPWYDSVTALTHGMHAHHAN